MIKGWRDGEGRGGGGREGRRKGEGEGGMTVEKREGWRKEGRENIVNHSKEIQWLVG